MPTYSDDMPGPNTKLIRPRVAVAADLDKQISLGRELRSLDIREAAELERVNQLWRTWHDRNKLIIGKSFSDDSAMKDYQPVMFATGTGSESKVVALHRNIDMLVQHLVTIRANLDLTDEEMGEEVVSLDPSSGEEIFIVHGHTHRDAVARVVERATGRQAIILQEQPDRGSVTVIEKLEREARRAGYAVVILAGDDEGKLRGTPFEPQPRARQNVIAELGYFIGRLGRSKVKALYEPGVELPSDFGGITYIELDAQESWRPKLTSELHAMGLARS